MSNLTEIRWHGRGGQGAKTASLLLADVAFNTGKFVQGFPEYGPERMGAPITAYNRISDTQIRVHSNIYNPDFRSLPFTGTGFQLVFCIQIIYQFLYFKTLFFYNTTSFRISKHHTQRSSNIVRNPCNPFLL